MTYTVGVEYTRKASEQEFKLKTVETEYVLDVICDHTTAKRLPEPVPERTVSKIYYLPNTRGAIGFLEWRAAFVDDHQYPRPVETYFDAALRLTANMSESERSRTIRDWNASDRLLTSWKTGNVMGGQRWRFWCSDCDATLPVTHEKLGPVLDKSKEHKLAQVTLRGLHARVSP